jgi:hypothetical protein
MLPLLGCHFPPSTDRFALLGCREARAADDRRHFSRSCDHLSCCLLVCLE